MATGMDYLLKVAIDKICENLPPETIDNIKQIGQTVTGFKAQADRIEANQIRILALLSDEFSQKKNALSGGDAEIVGHYDKPNQHFDTSGNIIAPKRDDAINSAGK